VPHGVGVDAGDRRDVCVRGGTDAQIHAAGPL
jgi:hypothetical protein